jgi:hypothetical protein
MKGISGPSGHTYIAGGNSKIDEFYSEKSMEQRYVLASRTNAEMPNS